MFVTPAYAQAAGGAGAGAAFAQFIPLILIFAIMYFLMIRPQQKRLKAHRTMVENVKKGDRVVTQGGILGKVVSVGEDELEVEIATGVRVRVIRSTLAQVVTKTEPVAANS
ncbi:MULTISPECIES: preprotein translocase subunit YajC [Paracoccus]|jgi:preprotein translocase subunit YajC|uniref:Sec translocon accessory complex subunit YajC n=2 Tax=Paracoccus TaxID=265 RepID=A0A5C4RB31_9RHOB|nr:MULTISPECIES: preprotein translocase subunit YajC [Paracoccus]TYP68780.1 protein translocase subunit yajC [Stutzerimonas stutzeri]AZY93549.1 preprotein translocase subunit YajC [Paracoccus sp. Arc7-R13]KIX19469.1 preprotein translocase subunit YajC [Paracoccus sp. 228]KJZ32596.1 preprotein translocase subunit YajC [Paracoccus sp. S4493]MBF5077937.1 preprotein translocase subunit YajC [Paracoccus sp. NBH48]|tara:strand:- start:6024 stop:6356 length:333 start_codon:yes stop_codon:yes gene_type:complete